MPEFGVKYSGLHTEEIAMRGQLITQKINKRNSNCLIGKQNL